MATKSTLIIATILLAAFFAGTIAKAELGGSVDTIENDRVALKSAVIKTETSSAKFTIHEMTYAGTTVREYENNGVVFAVAWNGMTHPDLSTLLGNYYASYKVKVASLAAEVNSARGARYHAVSVGKLVLEKDGHMRKLYGRAYDLTLFPVGVTLNDIN